MSKFKIGDRVQDEEGRRGVIIDIDSREKDYLVEYDRAFPAGHDGNNVTGISGKDGHCWWEYFDDIELEEDNAHPNKTPKLNIGDRVLSDKGEGTIIDIDPRKFFINEQNYLVEHDEKIPFGHNGSPLIYKEGKDGHCWWEFGRDLKLIEGTSRTTSKIGKHKEICNTLHEIYKAKNHGYGDSFGKSYRKYGLTSAMVRLSDKFNRLESISQKENKVEDETLEDTLMDMANYCIMTLIELEEYVDSLDPINEVYFDDSFYVYRPSSNRDF